MCKVLSSVSRVVVYDANGNTLSKSDSSGTTQYSWDYENRLTQAIVPGVGTTTFRYDPFARRIQKSGPSGTANFVYDGANVVQEMDSAGSILARYPQGLGIDEPFAQLRAGTTGYYHADGLGSITSLTNTSATAVATYSYDAFGKLSASTGSLTNPFRFTGREFDSETGLYYYRFRHYDQSTGRFISEDPIGWRGGSNFYRYADGNPVSLIDPLGLDVKVCYYSDAAAGLGHVGYGLPQEWEQNTSGFYPATHGLLNILDGPGKVKPDEQNQSKCKTIPAPRDRDQCMLQCRFRRIDNPGNYRLTSRQCTTFVRDCLRECGLPAGNYNGSFPKEFFSDLPGKAE